MNQWYEKEEDFSDASFDRSPFENDEDYEDRINDLNDFIDILND